MSNIIKGRKLKSTSNVVGYFKSTIHHPQDGQVSLGILNSTGSLIRTLRSNEPVKSGDETIYWDGLDEYGNGVTDICSLNKVFVPSSSHVDFKYVIGNTSAPGSGDAQNTSAHLITSGVWVGDNLYYAAGYAEGKQLCYFKANKSSLSTRIVLNREYEHSITHIAADSNKVYWLGQVSSDGKCVLTATNITDDSFYSWPKTQLIRDYKSAIGATSLTLIGNGLTVQQSGNYLVISQGTFDAVSLPLNFTKYQANGTQILVINKITGELVSTTSEVGVHEVTLAGENTLYYLAGPNGGNSLYKRTLNSDGTLSASTLIKDYQAPISLSYDKINNRLCLLDCYQRYTNSITNNHRVILISANSGQEISDVQQQNGGYENSPLVAPRKFCLWDSKLIARVDFGGEKAFSTFTSDGNLCLLDVGNWRFLVFDSSYNITNTLGWIGYTYSFRIDKGNTRRWFAWHNEFDVDASIGQWTLKANWSAKYNFEYQAEDYNILRDVHTFPNGKTYFIAQEQDRSKNSIWQFVEMRSDGYFFTNVFTDSPFVRLNSDGTLWTGTIPSVGQPMMYYKQTIDVSNNVPVLGNKVLVMQSPNLLDTDPYTSSAVVGKDLLLDNNGLVLLVGADSPQQNTGIGHGGKGYHLGTVRNGQWVSEFSPVTFAGYRGGFPLDGRFDIGNKVINMQSTWSGFGFYDRRFIQQSFNGEFWKNAQTNKNNIWTSNGLLAIQFGVANDSGSPYVAGYPGLDSNSVSSDWFPLDSSNSNSDWIFAHCGEGFQGGISVWRWVNPRDVIDVTYALTPSTKPVSTTENLLDGLVYASTVPNNSNNWTRTPVADNIVGDQNISRVVAGILSSNPNNLDVFIEQHPQSTGNWTTSATRTILTTISSSNNSIVFNGDLGWPVNTFDSDNNQDFNGIKILDANSKVLVAINRVQVSFPNDYELRLNGQNVQTLNIFDWQFLMRYLQSFKLILSDSGVTFQYSTFNSITLPFVDSSANWRNTKYLQLLSQTINSNREGGVAIRAKVNVTTPPNQGSLEYTSATAA